MMRGYYFTWQEMKGKTRGKKKSKQPRSRMTVFKQLLSSGLVDRRAALIAWPGHLWSLAGFAGLIAGGIESGGQSGVS